MRPPKLLCRVAGVAAVATGLGLGLSACGAETAKKSKGGVSFDVGVTAEPCPGSANRSRGCIYLGTLSDLTEGPFAPVGTEVTRAQKDFWARVNAAGGIRGFDVDVGRYTRDNKYNPSEHVAKYREIAPNVLALAQSLGTPTTLAAIDLYKADDVVAGAATWWSGWAFVDDGILLESGSTYCMEAMNGLDHAAEEFGKPDRVLAVGYASDYGQDYVAGVKHWGTRNGVAVATAETAPNAQAGNQDAVVTAIRRQNPDIVMLATSPAEMAEIVGKSVGGGFDGEFVGAGPSFNPAVMTGSSARAIQDKFRFTMPWGPYGSDTPAHRAMEKALGGKPPRNDYYGWGWVLSYPLKAVLEQAARNGDLTRKGLRGAIAQVTVDYEGALPDRRYGGTPNDTVVRESLIVRPDERAPLKSSIERPFAVGATAKAYKLDAPCSKAP